MRCLLREAYKQNFEDLVLVCDVCQWLLLKIKAFPKESLGERKPITETTKFVVIDQKTLPSGKGNFYYFPWALA